MCALQGRRRTGAFEPPEGDPVWGAGAPGPRAAGAPFTSMELEKELEGDLRGTNHRDKTNFLRGGLPPEGSRTVRLTVARHSLGTHVSVRREPVLFTAVEDGINRVTCGTHVDDWRL